MVSNQNQKPNRQKFLNIIYFVDSNRTKTLKFSLNVGYVIFGALVATILWSMISTVLLVNSYNHSNKQSERVQNLLSTIFNYQTRYDSVYEKTYPADKIPKKLPELEDYDKKPEPLLSDGKAKSIETTANTISLAAKPKPIAKPEVKKAKEAPAKTTQESKRDSLNPVLPQRTSPEKEEQEYVKLDKFSVFKEKANLKVTVAIRNQIRPKRAHGFVIGFARYIGLDGKTHTISSPPGFSIDQKVKRLDLPRTHRFSIRYYTKKTLLFDLPDKKGGTFESIKVYVHKKNSDKLEFVYNIKGDKGTFSPNLGTAPKETLEPTESINASAGNEDSETIPEPSE